MLALASRTAVHSLGQDQLNCLNCNKRLKVFTHRVSPQIEKLITSLEVVKHMQEVASCQSCKIGMATAVKPATPISGCILGPRLLANCFVNRFNDGLPYYRIKRSLSREGYPVPLSNFSNWQIRTAASAKPLYDLIKSEILLSKVIKTDDTECKIQVPKLKLAKTRTPRNIRKGKMTAILGDKNHPFNLFDFSPDKSFARNIAFFRNFFGHIQADGAGGFDVLFLANSLKLCQCFEVGCHAHARRKFYDCLTTHIKEAAFILDLYQSLFDIEDRITGKSDEEILSARQAEAKPILEKIIEKLLELKPTLSPKDEFLAGINYFLKNWEALSRYLSDPDLDISNNDTERLIKEFVLVRKNILFMGSDKAGHASAILMTLIASANRNNLNPVDYLADVFTRINSLAHDPEQLRQLLPDRWTPPPPTVNHSL
jgi:transposase